MLPSPKRPRLHFLASISPDPDGELAAARARNDGLLKTRWEHIFARYEKDFEGVGDEISFLGDQIVVDNGHIRSMQDAQDTGVTRLGDGSPTSPSRYDGRRLLRAMTVAPSENSEDSASNDDADEVLQSIETIADNIVAGDESSDDDLFDIGPTTRASPHVNRSTYRDATENVHIKAESDVDSLFDTRPVIRSPSVDDLFCIESPLPRAPEPVAKLVWRSSVPDSVDPPEMSAGSVHSRDTLERTIIRDEVRKVLDEENQAQEAQIEPAWRIPVRVPHRKLSRPISVPLTAPERQSTHDSKHLVSTVTPVDDNEESLWRAPTRSRRSRREVAAERSLKRLRAESEDPLQDGFTSDMEQPSNTFPKKSKHSASDTASRSSGQSHSSRVSSVSLREWQNSVPVGDAVETSSVNGEVTQHPSKEAKAVEMSSRRSRDGSSEPSLTSDTIVVRVPTVQKIITRKGPNG